MTNPFNNNQSADDRVKKARLSIMRNPTFCAFSGVLSIGKLTLTKKLPMPTAATDGFNIMVHPDFVDTLNDAQLRLLLLHEAVHIAYQHVGRYRHLYKIHAQCANIAADHFVNLSLIDADKGAGYIEMPSVGVQPDPKYRGWTVERIFHDLMRNPPPQQQSGKGKGQPGQGEPGDDDPQGIDEHDWESGEGVPADVQAARSVEIDRILRQGEEIAKRMRGKGAGDRSTLIEDLLTPEVPWRQLLQEFVQETCVGRDESTWARPSRRYMSADMYMPTMYSEKMAELLVGFDTSGSCFGGEVLSRFLTELKAVCDTVRPGKLRVVCWDYSIQSDQVFDDIEQFDWRNVTVKGGGGTDGSLLSTYMKEKNIRPQAVINFTDGYVGSWGESDVPTLWAITESSIVAPWGRTVHITA